MGRLDLCVITARLPRLQRGHREVAGAALEGGAGVIQLRDKELGTGALLALARELRRLTRDRGALLIINDRVEVALAAEADGVHLGQEDLPVAEARRLMGREAIVGASVANVEEARAAEAARASYVSLGSVFATGSKADAGEPVGVGGVREIKGAVGVPVLAIGGISCENVGEVIRAGADGVAVISAVTEAEDMVGATAELLRRIAEARAGGAVR